MKWEQRDKYNWQTDGARIKFLPNPDAYYVYKGGEYLGSNPTLAAAQERARTGEKSVTHLKDELPSGTPAFLALDETDRPPRKVKQPAPERAPITRRPEMPTEYKDMSLEALVRAYNESVEIAQSKGLTKFKPAQRFENIDAAVKANEKIESSIKAASQAAAAEQRREGPPPKPPTKAELRKEGEAAVKTHTKKKRAEAKAAKAEAKAAKAAEPAKGKDKPTPATPSAPKGKAGEFAESVGARIGTNKEKLASLLFNNLGKSLEMSAVTKHIYGKAENSAISAVIGGLKSTVKDRSLPYDILVKENKVGLFAKGR